MLEGMRNTQGTRLAAAPKARALLINHLAAAAASLMTANGYHPTLARYINGARLANGSFGQQIDGTEQSCGITVRGGINGTRMHTTCSRNPFLNTKLAIAHGPSG